MAKFVATHTDDGTVVSLNCGDAEEISTEQAQAFAAIRSAQALETIELRMLQIVEAIKEMKYESRG